MEIRALAGEFVFSGSSDGELGGGFVGLGLEFTMLDFGFTGPRFRGRPEWRRTDGGRWRH